MQKLKDSTSIPFGAQKQAEIEIKPLGMQVPDVHESMKLAGVKDVQLNSSSSSTASNTRQQRVICCCGSRSCGIGPMTIVEQA